MRSLEAFYGGPDAYRRSCGRFSVSSSGSVSACASGFGPRKDDPQCGHESISFAYAARQEPQKQSDPVCRWITCDVVARTWLRTSSCVPMRMRSPSFSSISPLTGTPFTRQPLRLPRSSSMACWSSTKMRACRREIAGSKMVIWQSSPRPMSVWPGGKSNSCNKNRRRYRAGLPWLSSLIPRRASFSPETRCNLVHPYGRFADFRTDPLTSNSYAGASAFQASRAETGRSRHAATHSLGGPRRSVPVRRPRTWAAMRSPQTAPPARQSLHAFELARNSQFTPRMVTALVRRPT
jgi:hypothetical protein